MAIHTQQINQIEGGFAKEVDEGSMRMILDNLQVTQYSYPQKSTIRELASNGIDAIRERDIALRILAGKAKVEDHYVVREGTEYKDSGFNHSYYDPNWLSDDPNVYITYKDGGALKKDMVIIRDNGVGLWGNRLVGYFKLSYSTKRLSRFGLGKYGIGAKSVLSTGVDYYVVINRYNGREMWFNISRYAINPCTPRYNMQTGQENPILEMNNGYQVHYIPTTEKNGLEIQWEAKKHHRQMYIDAVKSQLLYFDDVKFFLEAENGVKEAIPVQAKVLYENDIMILSDNEMYSKPHVLINRVNYGNIDFKELELEDKMGNISIKLQPEEVSVSPSREHVLWDDMTKQSVVRRFKEVQAVSENLLQKELEESDFMKWLRACIVVKNRINTEQGAGIISRLAKLVDLRNYEPVFKPDPQFKLNRDLFAGVKVRRITGKTVREGSDYKFKVERDDVSLADLVNTELPIFIQQSETNFMRDRYLLEDVYTDGFITIWLNELEPRRPEVSDALDESQVEQLYQSRKTAFFNHVKTVALDLKWIWRNKETMYIEQSAQEIEAAVERVIDRWRKFNGYILSSEGLQHYESFDVPQEYLDRHKTVKETKEGEEEEEVISREAEVQTKEARLSAEARRKQAGKTLLYTPGISITKDQLTHWEKLEIPTKSIDEWDNPEIYYSSEDNSSLIQLAALIIRPSEALGSRILRTGTRSHLIAYDEAPVRLIKVAKDRVKFYLDFKHIQSFYGHVDVKNKRLIMSNALIKWNTARYIHDQLPRLQFLNGFKPFNEEMHIQYKAIIKYHSDYYRSVDKFAGKYKEVKEEEYDSMIKHLDRVAELQIFVRDHKTDDQAIAAMVRDLFGTQLENVVTDAGGLDMTVYDIVQKLLEYVEPLHLMLNRIPLLTMGGEYNEDGNLVDISMTEDLEQEIRHYIQFKQAGL